MIFWGFTPAAALKRERERERLCFFCRCCYIMRTTTALCAASAISLVVLFWTSLQGAQVKEKRSFLHHWTIFFSLDFFRWLLSGFSSPFRYEKKRGKKCLFSTSARAFFPSSSSQFLVLLVFNCEREAKDKVFVRPFIHLFSFFFDSLFRPPFVGGWHNTF